MGGRTTPRFSRSGATSPLGKCTTRLDIPCSDKLKDTLAALGTISGGRPAAEYAREVLEKHCFGVLPLMQAKIGGSNEPGDGMNRG